VQGAADFERSTLTAVTEARASVGRAQLPPGLPNDPATLQNYMQAQQTLGATLGRLFAVAEQYPQLRATQNFLSLQDQLEGTENRIAVARRDYIESVRAYNTYRRRFPTNLIAGMMGFDTIAQLEVEPAVREAPQVEFNTGDE
jgi:LemA protein